MSMVNIYEAKTHLSRLVEEAAKGHETVIAKAGRPVARLVPFEPVKRQPRKLGLLEGKYTIPDDFDTMFQDEIRTMFEDGPLVEDWSILEPGSEPDVQAGRDQQPSAGGGE